MRPHLLALCSAVMLGVLSALAHIHSLRRGVCCIHRVARISPREGAGSLPALLLDQGQLPPTVSVYVRRALSLCPRHLPSGSTCSGPCTCSWSSVWPSSS